MTDKATLGGEPWCLDTTGASSGRIWYARLGFLCFEISDLKKNIGPIWIICQKQNIGIVVDRKHNLQTQHQEKLYFLRWCLLINAAHSEITQKIPRSDSPLTFIKHDTVHHWDCFNWNWNICNFLTATGTIRSFPKPFKIMFTSSPFHQPTLG